MKDGPYLARATQPTLPNGPTSTTTVTYADSVPPQRERACLDLLWIHESIQYSVKHLAARCMGTTGLKE